MHMKVIGVILMKDLYVIQYLHGVWNVIQIFYINMIGKVWIYGLHNVLGLIIV